MSPMRARLGGLISDRFDRRLVVAVTHGVSPAVAAWRVLDRGTELLPHEEAAMACPTRAIALGRER